MTHQRFRVAILILAVAATCVGVSEAITLGCGDTIGPASGTFTLEADVTCEKVTVLPAITIVGPARLDMNGHAVLCKFDPDAVDSPNGIMLHGPAALVMNGTVRGCSSGIRVQGDRNRVAGMTIASGNAGGIDVFGDQNVITSSSVRANEGPVVVVVGDRNLVHRNVVSGPFPPPGSEILHGIGAFGDYNEIRENTVRQADAGFEFSGLRTVLVGNVADGNLVGFFASELSRDCLLYDNVATRNDDGFWVAGTNCIVRGNVASDNEDAGVGVGGTGNVISANRASGNLTVDLVDGNGDCVANSWRKNVFETASPACIE